MRLFSKIPTRLCPWRDFPEYAFIPGKHIHPNKPGGHSFESEALITTKIDEKRPWLSEELGFALDLYHAGYFWESHVYLEAIWNAHERIGAVADLMKALIKLSAAGVKFELGQGPAAHGHLTRALELFRGLSDDQLGIDLRQLTRKIEVILENKSAELPAVDPNWPLV